MARPRVAIACQGGGSLTAFASGVLVEFLQAAQTGKFDIVAFSGTSGGAICALLAWYGLLKQGPQTAIQLLESFWEKNSATTYWDAVFNSWLVGMANLQDSFPVQQVSPYQFPGWGQERLRSLIASHVDFDELAALVQARGPSAPRLLISAVDVCCGEFKVFHGEYGNLEITAEAVLASTALPTLFKAVHIDGHIYWDGLLAQNPPVRNFLIDCRPEQRPDEIWLIQVNPKARNDEPKSVGEIVVRRSELSGNLSLKLEIDAIKRINLWVREGFLPKSDFGTVRVRRVEISSDISDRLGLASKLDRNPEFIQSLVIDGRRQATTFLALERHVAEDELYP
jgi:NTE family protein